MVWVGLPPGRKPSIFTTAFHSPPPGVRLNHPIRSLLLGLTLVSAALAGCRPNRPCEKCDTIVIAATGEPSSVLPPLVIETVGRDIGDQVFERLADLQPGRAPIDSTAYVPGLAARWERLDSTTWRFQLRPGAHWSDGRAVTAGDVAFSFKAFADSALDAPARPYLNGRVWLTVEAPSAVLIHFARRYPEQLYDATYHVRIIPKHIWEGIPPTAWGGDTSLARLVGSGPYRVAAWVRGQALTLEADPHAARRAATRRLVWRFAEDPDAALNLVLSHEADLLETLGPPDRVSRAGADTTLALIRYPSAAYGFQGFRLGDETGRAHPILSDRAVRRALAQAVDRRAIAQSTFGADTKAPPGPMSQLLWIWDDSVAVAPFDTAAAGRTLDASGWQRRAAGTVRTRNGRNLAIDILVPGTSPSRKRIAEAVQQMWRAIGVNASVTTVDFPVFQERLGQGKFDSYIGAWLDEPSARGLADQWTRTGWTALNYGHYSNPVFDTLFARAVRASELPVARRAWRETLDTLNADAPAIFLYAPTNVAAASRRLEGVQIDPYSWLSGVAGWRVRR